MSRYNEAYVIIPLYFSYRTFDGEQIGPYTPSRGFGSEPGGLLRFSEFNDQMEGVYSCIAQTESESRIEHFFEYKVVEFCQAGKTCIITQTHPCNKQQF